ncbi:hypothetical protein HK096_009773 [Nowakowskiella sp. JEL0078]|nr:hypothetical protein HK096_009773 [Nowakowskiella sp. JEL0078]
MNLKTNSEQSSTIPKLKQLLGREDPGNIFYAPNLDQSEKHDQVNEDYVILPKESNNANDITKFEEFDVANSDQLFEIYFSDSDENSLDFNSPRQFSVDDLFHIDHNPSASDESSQSNLDVEALAESIDVLLKLDDQNESKKTNVRRGFNIENWLDSDESDYDENIDNRLKTEFIVDSQTCKSSTQVQKLFDSGNSYLSISKEIEVINVVNSSEDDDSSEKELEIPIQNFKQSIDSEIEVDIDLDTYDEIFLQTPIRYSPISTKQKRSTYECFVEEDFTLT